MKVKPLKARVLVETIEESKTSAGIILPEQARKVPQEGRVVAIGPDQNSVKVGDVIIYAKYGVSEITIDKKEYLLVEDDDVLAIKGGK